MYTIDPALEAAYGSQIRLHLKRYHHWTDRELRGHLHEEVTRQRGLGGLLQPCPIGAAIRFLACARPSQQQLAQAERLLKNSRIRSAAIGVILEKRGYQIGVAISLEGVYYVSIVNVPAT